MNCASQLIGNYSNQLEQQYGFVADKDMPLCERVEQHIGDIDTAKLCT